MTDAARTFRRHQTRGITMSIVVQRLNERDRAAHRALVHDDRFALVGVAHVAFGDDLAEFALSVLPD